MPGFLKQFNKKHQHHHSLPTTSTQSGNSNLVTPPPPLDRSLSDTSTPSDRIPRSSNIGAASAQPIEVPTSPTKSAGLAIKNWFSDWSPRKNNTHRHFAYDKPGMRRTSSGNISNISCMDDVASTPSQRSVFDTSLQRSMEIAKCEIVLTGSFSDKKFGYVPVVVAKCGSIIKQYGLATPGLFRIGGNKKRIDHLAREVFSHDPLYGLNFEYETPTTPGERAQYTIHDFASLLKAYLSRLDESVVPHALFEQFVEVIPKIDDRTAKYYDVIGSPTVTDKEIAEANATLAPSPESVKKIVDTFHDLILQMPEENRELLAYILDILNLVQKRSATNLMTPQNLAIIFQPSLLSPEDFTTNMDAHRLARHTLQFLIQHFDALAADYLFDTAE